MENALMQQPIHIMMAAWQHLSNQDIQRSERQATKHKCWCDQMIFVEREPDLFTEDDNEPVESSEEEEDDDEAIRHDLVTSLHRPVVLLQLLGSDVDVVFTSIVR